VEVTSIIETSIIIIINFFERGERIPRIWLKNQLKSLMARQISWTYYQRGGRFSALAVYWGSFIGFVWYYAELYKQGEKHSIFQTTQKIYGIQRKSETTRDIRQKFQNLIKTGMVEKTTWRKLL
jgi:hypothetical protein